MKEYNYRTRSLVSDASKPMLRIILRRLTPYVDYVPSGEIRFLKRQQQSRANHYHAYCFVEKMTQHQREVQHNFTDIKKERSVEFNIKYYGTSKECHIEVYANLYGKCKVITTTNEMDGRRWKCHRHYCSMCKTGVGQCIEIHMSHHYGG